MLYRRRPFDKDFFLFFQWVWQEKLQNLVLQFADCPSLYNRIVTLLVECIQQYAQLLRHSKVKRKLLDPCMFENIHYVFKCLEILIHSGENHGFSILNCDTLVSLLEDSLLYISEFLPGFSLYVWQINGLLENLTSHKSKT